MYNGFSVILGGVGLKLTVVSFPLFRGGSADERREDTDLDRRVGVRAGRDHPEATEPGRVTLHIDAGIFGDSI